MVPYRRRLGWWWLGRGFRTGHLFDGIEKVDSITIDPHKWLFSPYDCGAVIYKNPKLAEEAHAQEGSYLEIFKEEGAECFNPSDYQIQLTRRVRGFMVFPRHVWDGQVQMGGRTRYFVGKFGG